MPAAAAALECRTRTCAKPDRQDSEQVTGEGPMFAAGGGDESRPICRGTDIEDIAKQLILKAIIIIMLRGFFKDVCTDH